MGISHNPAHNHCNNYTNSHPAVSSACKQDCAAVMSRNATNLSLCYMRCWRMLQCYSHKQDKQIKSVRNKNTSCSITLTVKTLHCQFILASGLLAGCLRSESFWWLALVKCCLTGYFLLLYLHGERTHRTTQGRQETG